MAMKNDNLFNENNVFDISGDNRNQYSNLNLNQSQKVSNTYLVQSYGNGISKYCNGSFNGSNTESSNKLFKTHQTDQEDKIHWKNDKRSDNTLTLNTDEWKIKKDVLDVDKDYFSKLEQFGPIRTRQNTTQFPTALFIQNPFEFSRQQNDKFSSDPEVSQFKACQRLFNPNESSKSGIQMSIDNPDLAPSLNDPFIQKIYAPQFFKNQDKENANFDVAFKFGTKLLHAHYKTLSEASPTFNSWLSVRWTRNMNHPIAVDFFSFDDFF